MRGAWLAVLLAFAAPAAAQPAAARPLRILFVGNSLVSHGKLPERLAALATAMGRAAAIDAVTDNDFSLEDHWNDGRAAAAIAKGWDVVVLQQGPSARADSRAQLVDYTRRFAKPIREAGARTALLMAWPSSDRPEDFPGAIRAYRAAASAADAMILPVAEAWLRAISHDKRLRLYSDPVHPASLGTDLAVLTIYFALFPAGPQEFDEAFVARLGIALSLPAERRDPLVDAATRAIDEPMALE